jgi:hypothetical protein
VSSEPPDCAILLGRVEDLVRRTRERSCQTKSLARRSRDLIALSQQRIAGTQDIVDEFAITTGDDRALIRLTAGRMVRWHGRDACRILCESEAEAVRRGDQLAAETWADIARAVEELLGDEFAAQIRC